MTTKPTFHWNDETLEYFENKDWREIWNFVKNECDLEDGETYEMLANDLMKQTRINNDNNIK